MANRKDEGAGGYAPNERPAQSAASPAEQGARPSETQGAADPKAGQKTSRTAEEVNRTMEASRQAMEQTGKQATEFGRQATEQTAHLADRELRQAADIARRQAEQARSLIGASSTAYREMTEYSRADFDAMMQSGARLARGLQEMSWEMTQFTQQSMRLGVQLANDLMECRSIEDMVAVQRDFMKESVDVLLAEGARLLSMSSRMADDAANPITQRVGNGSAEKAGREAEEAGRGQAPRGQAQMGGGREARQ